MIPREAKLNLDLQENQIMLFVTKKWESNILNKKDASSC